MLRTYCYAPKVTPKALFLPALATDGGSKPYRALPVQWKALDCARRLVCWHRTPAGQRHSPPPDPSATYLLPAILGNNTAQHIEGAAKRKKPDQGVVWYFPLRGLFRLFSCLQLY